MLDDAMVKRLVLARFEAAFGTPRRPADQLTAMMREYARVFRPVPPARLPAIVDAIIEGHDQPGWPRIGVCRQVISARAPGTRTMDGAQHKTVVDDPDCLFRPGDRVTVEDRRSGYCGRAGRVLCSHRYAAGTRFMVSVDLDENEVWFDAERLGKAGGESGAARAGGPDERQAVVGAAR